MDTSSSVLLTAIIVTAGQWANGKGLTVRIALAAVFLALMLSVIGETQPKFSRQFALLILVSATLAYAPIIIQKSGLSKRSAK
jgi:hypothetical protein